MHVKTFIIFHSYIIIFNNTPHKRKCVLDHYSKVLLGELGCDPTERVVERQRPLNLIQVIIAEGKMIITAHSYKGRTGKTLFSVNLATSPGKRGKKSLSVGFRFPGSKPQRNI
jgi:hypothetical protein